MFTHHFSSSGIYITSPMHTLKNSQSSILYSPRTILYILKQKSIKKLPWLDWKLKQYFHSLTKKVFWIERILKQYFSKWHEPTSYHVMYAFQSESKLYSCLNVKKSLAQNRCNIWSLSDYNGFLNSQPLCL